VLRIVSKLVAASPGFGGLEDVAKLGDRVLKHIQHRARWGLSRACTRQQQRVLAWGLDFVGRTYQVLLHQRTDIVEVKVVASVFKFNLRDLADFLLTLDAGVDRIKDAQHPRGVSRNRLVNVQLLLKAQALEPLGHRLPLVNIYSFFERPVCVYPAARSHQATVL